MLELTAIDVPQETLEELERKKQSVESRRLSALKARDLYMKKRVEGLEDDEALEDYLQKFEDFLKHKMLYNKIVDSLNKYYK